MPHLKEYLNYTFPKELIATRPQEPCRVLCAQGSGDIKTSTSDKILGEIMEPGDVLVVNHSGVRQARIFYNDQEILFLKALSATKWEVLFKASAFKEGDTINLPEDILATLIKKGRPQVLELSREITLEYFEKHGEFALPPYIQKQRTSRRNVKDDKDWYQLDWKKNTNSLAAPTASLHFETKDLEALAAQGVFIEEVSLDVGLGTFLPLEEKNFTEKKLHTENFFVSGKTKEKMKEAKRKGKTIWALGTTALRALESCKNQEGDEFGETDLFIYPGYEFKWVTGLLTNFHQPGSSLLALVMAFYGIEETQKIYKYAVENKFRLFSYGDLSVWKK